MRPLLLSLAVILFLYCLLGRNNAQAPPPGTPFPLIQNGSTLVPTNRPIPGFFTNATTKYQFQSSQQQCKAYCVRKDIKTWSNKQWALYIQLWNEANRRGYSFDIQKMHALDCNYMVDNICAFHFDKAFFAWHRFFISHLEQAFQKIDHEINPGRHLKEGEFCLGYWDWGYQEPFNNDLENGVYKYLFGPQAIGTLIGTNGDNVTRNIPDGGFKNLRIPPTGPGNFTVRSPSLGNNSWNAATVSSCVSHNDAEANGDASQGLRPCIELGCHGAIHTAIGGIMGNLQWSAGEPAFFLHHTMIDYIWWTWQHRAGGFYPNTPAPWNDPVPQPYEQWMMDDAKDWGRFCFTYQPNGWVTQKSNYTSGGSGSKAPGSYGSLGSSYQNAVDRIFSQGQPSVIDKSKWAQFVSSHISQPQLVDMLYASYEKGAKYAQTQYNNVTSQYASSYKSSNVRSNVASTPSASLQSSTPVSGGGSGSADAGVVTEYLNSLVGSS